jgi:hypothetical protein
MKKMFIVISILLSVSVVSFSCGGSSINCNKACDKLNQCGSITDVASCKTTCGKLNNTLNDDVLSKLNSCTNQTCENIASCRNEAFQNCKTDLSGFFDKICEQIHSCNEIVPVETCINSLVTTESSGSFNTLKCLDGGFLNSLASCTSEVVCDLQAVTNCISEKTKFLSENS